MRVKNLMVLTVSLILALCANTAFSRDFSEIPLSARGGGFVYELFYGLMGDDRKMHVSTVILAASSLDTGAVAEWHNPDSGNAGRVKVVMTKPEQGGRCRLLFTQVEKGNTIREYEEYACYTMDSPYWRFYEPRR